MNERFARLLNERAPGTALRNALKQDAGPWPCFLQEAERVPAGPLPYHSGSLLDHLVRCMNTVAGDALAVWMALVHDAGKLTTPKSLWPHHYGHETRGVLLATEWGRFLNMPEPFTRCGRMAARLHMKAGRYARLRPGTKVDLLLEVEASPCADAFWALVDADTRADVSRQARADRDRIRAVPCDGLWGEALRQRQIQAVGVDALQGQDVFRQFSS